MPFESPRREPQWLSKPDILGTYLSSAGQALGCLLWGTNSFVYQRNSVFEMPLNHWLPHQGWGFWWGCICASPICFSVSLYHLLQKKKALQLVFRPFSDGIFLYVYAVCSSICRFSVSMGRGEFTVFLCHYLGPPFFHLLF